MDFTDSLKVRAKDLTITIKKGLNVLTFKSISPSRVAITGAQPASELVQLSIIVSHMYTSFKTK